MTIRRRLILAFLSIIFLFGLSTAISFWGDAKIGSAVDDLRRAQERQLVLAEVGKGLDNLNQLVTVTGQLYSAVDVAGGTTGDMSGVPHEEVEKFKKQLEELDQKIVAVRELSTDEAGRWQVQAFRDTYGVLARSWTIVYENIGRDAEKHMQATMEQTVTAEPLSMEMRAKILPDLAKSEENRVKIAKENYDFMAKLTSWLNYIIFAVSLVVAVIVAYRVARYLTRGLAKLESGASAIGSGNLDQRIEIPSRDELGDLARSFNTMAEKLLAARTELTAANTELERGKNELTSAYSELERGKKDIEAQQERAMSLLLNILPVQVAQELQSSGQVEPKYFEDVTILFTDFKGFTLSTEKLAAEELVYMLHDHFTVFDEIVKRYGIEKIKTIGDSYMCAGGLPDRKPSHPVDVVLAALEMAHAVEQHNMKDIPAKWQVRIGIHTGSVIAGVVGTKKFAFDIWGDTVNYASRMESSGVPMMVNMSETTMKRVKDFIESEPRGKVQTKEKRELDMFFAHGILPKLLDDTGVNPPAAFQRRYRVYFQKDAPQLSEFLLRPAQPRAKVELPAGLSPVGVG